MRIDTETQTETVTYFVTIDAEELDGLLLQADDRMAKALKTSVENARVRAQEILTDKELESYYTGIVIAKASDMVLGDSAFLFDPETQFEQDLEPGSPFEFSITVFPIPHGDAPAGPKAFSVALEHQKARYRKMFEEEGISETQYRLRHLLKPEEFKAELQECAQNEIDEIVLLEQTFRDFAMEVEEKDELKCLAEAGEGNEPSARAEFEDTGKRWMLLQRTRRSMAKEFLERLA